MSKAKKGSAFERELCKTLSMWWTNKSRDDIFWRSSQSGGRATQRAKSGKRTFGSYGDIAAVDPAGAPLLDMFTIELKRGSTYSCLGDLLDFKPDNLKHPWVKCLTQAIRSHELAGSKAWMLICRRDHRESVVYLEWELLMKLWDSPRSCCPLMRFRVWIGHKSKVLAGLTLSTFLEQVTPYRIQVVRGNITRD